MWTGGAPRPSRLEGIMLCMPGREEGRWRGAGAAITAPVHRAQWAGTHTGQGAGGGAQRVQ